MTSVLVSSPFVPPSNSLRRLMINVVIGLVPGTLAYWWFFGFGVLVNILLAVILAIGFEASILMLRKKPVMPHIFDFSAVVAAWLLALCLPMHAPWWLVLVGVGFSMIVGKHLYGGLGFNPFNPAMAGYVALLISFPIEMTTWYLPFSISGESLSLTESFRYSFGLSEIQIWDGLTSATPLDTLRSELSRGINYADTRVAPIFGRIAGKGWEWIAIAWLAGGFWLLYSRTIMWFIPVAVLTSSLLFYGIHHMIDPEYSAGSLFNLLSGGLMIGAFFIATDPVTAATTNKGRLIYGVLIGFITYVIRSWGGYPDGVAFAVLLANMCVPLIDYYTQPKVYGGQ
jgi:Na+-translocating ferredoxin:NAD+ oxidoreductase subunit D